MLALQTSEVQIRNSVSTLVITNFPDSLRSEVLRREAFGGGWMDTNVCLGIPRTRSRLEMDSEIESAGLPKPPDRVYESLSLSEIGCIYAHMKALVIASKSDGMTLILEDDAEFDREELQRVLKHLEGLPKDAIVKLEGCQKRGRRIVFGPKSGDCPYMLSMRPSNGSAGYIVTPLAAENILRLAFGYCHPYDMLLNDASLHRCLLVDAVPFPVRQSSTVASTIVRGNKGPGLINKLIRHKEKLWRRVRRYTAQLSRAKEARYSRIRYAKFYD